MKTKVKINKIRQGLAVAIMTLLVACSGEANKEESVETQQSQLTRVKLEKVSMQDVPQLGEFTATVEAQVKNNIAPQTPFRIKEIAVEVGDRVKKGQLLAKMDATNLQQAKIQLENQEVEFKRIDELYKVGGTSKSAWDAQKTALDIARTSFKNLIENTQLLSPINGIITARNYDSGDMYSGATPIFTVEQIRPVKLIVNVSESLFTKVKKGHEVDVRFDVYGDEIFKGRISLVYPTIDPATRTFPVEIRIQNSEERVRPGMFARVTMNFGSIRRVVAPDRSIVKQAGAGDRYIYVYNDGKVDYRKVEIGRRFNDKYEIISGVADGDQVVVTGQSRLTNGMEVEIEK